MIANIINDLRKWIYSK